MRETIVRLSLLTLCILSMSSMASATNITTTYGKAQLDNFLIDPSYKNFNHGSFGATPRYVIQAQQDYVLQQEAKPDVWFRSTYKQYMSSTRDAVAKECGLFSSDNLVLLENASAAVNSIFRSMQFNPGDIFIYFSSAYGMVKHTAAWLEVSAGIRILEVPLSIPITSTAGFFFPMRSALEALSQDERERVKIATFSHISSVPAFIEPINEVRECDL